MANVRGKLGPDASRHLVLYTEPAMGRIVQEGFGAEGTFYDSSTFQFWGSEMVRGGKPHAAGPSEFTSAQLSTMRGHAARLNAAREGDSIGFILRRSDVP